MHLFEIYVLDKSLLDRDSSCCRKTLQTSMRSWGSIMYRSSEGFHCLKLKFERIEKTKSKLEILLAKHRRVGMEQGTKARLDEINKRLSTTPKRKYKEKRKAQMSTDKRTPQAKQSQNNQTFLRERHHT